MPSEWDFFLAHAGPNQAQAEELYGYLVAGKARVFLDSRSLLYGDDWDDAIAKAQREADAGLTGSGTRRNIRVIQALSHFR